MPFNLLSNKGTAAQWDFALRDILSFRNNRLIVLQVSFAWPSLYYFTGWTDVNSPCTL